MIIEIRFIANHILILVIKRKNLSKKYERNIRHAKDMHAIIYSNKDIYKDEFMKIYNHKCAYCGVSSEVITRSDFEIDHYIYEKSKKFATKADAGYIENLVLACHDCNHDKSSFEFPDEKYKDFYPDEKEIAKTFIRDDKFYIKISEEKKDDAITNEFYKKLNLGSELHRIDYLLMNMIGLQETMKDKTKTCSELGEAIQKLHTKRNVMCKNV